MRTLAKLTLLVGLLALFVATSGSAVGGKPLIGPPKTVPGKAVAGKSFTVSFQVTRNGTPLRTGRMICDPSVSGKVIAHAESFRAGLAKLSFTIPSSAANKQLKVKLTIAASGQSSTRTAFFSVAAPPPSSLSVKDARVAEGNSGTTPLNVQVSLSAAYPLPVTVSYQTADGSATAPSDYTVGSGTVTFKPGQTTQQVTVGVVGDTAVEQDETFTVRLSSPVNATLGNAIATATIANDDFAPKDGHYAGTTSQGLSVGFDVSGGATVWSNFIIATQVTCQEVPGVILVETFDFTGISSPLAADWSWNVNENTSDADGTYALAFNGKLTPPGSATGTFRFDMALNTDAGVAHCSTGTVNWSASG
jgi:Calx-beta domain-containing protein